MMTIDDDLGRWRYFGDGISILIRLGNQSSIMIFSIDGVMKWRSIVAIFNWEKPVLFSGMTASNIDDIRGLMKMLLVSVLSSVMAIRR